MEALLEIFETCTQYSSVLSGQLRSSPLRVHPHLGGIKKPLSLISSLGTWTGLRSWHHFSQLLTYALTLCEAVSLKEKLTNKM